MRLLAIAAVLLSALAASAEDMPGTVYVSRWLDESQNTSWGHWNHLAIYVGNGEVIESQSDQGVIVTPLAEYEKRPQTVTKLYPRTKEIGLAAAAEVRKRVGRPYGQVASVAGFVRFGRDNCVSVVEQAYRPQTGFVWGIRRPDHVWKLVK